MSPPSPPPAAADTRPTMADLLFQQEAIRRDHAAVDAARRRVETPKPLVIDIEAIERQYAAGGDWTGIASRIGQSRPYPLPRAKFDMVIETGKAFAKTPLQKIMAALVGSTHGNPALNQLYEEFLVGQVSKMPGGNLRLKVKTQAGCMRLERTTVSILGGVYPFKPFDVLANKFYLDISNVDSDTDTDVMLHRLFLLGCQPVYDTFRDVNLATGLTSATWRVFFRSDKCPPPLLVNGSVCDQVIFDNKLHPAHGKDAPFQSERLPFGFRSHHGIDLVPPAPVARAGPRFSSLRNAKVIDIDDALSISTLRSSTGKISPPASPKTKSKPMVMITDGFTTVENKKKRTCGGVDFASMLTKQVPRPLDGISTKNYFAELRTVSASFQSFDASVDPKYGMRHQIVPAEVKIPAALKASKEAAFFVEKRHTTISKAKTATPMAEVVESMANDENTVLLNTLPDLLASADGKVDGIVKIVENTANPDHVIKKVVESASAFNSAMSLKMAGSGHEIAELAQIHLINRREDLFKVCAKWWTSSEPVRELSRLMKALSVFELALMSAAPTIFAKDHWIQFVTGGPVQWVPAHHARLLHPNALLKLLRSDLGTLCMEHWRHVQWQGHLLDELEELRKLEGEYPTDGSVLKLQVADDGSVALSFCNQFFHDAKYFDPKHAGDHLAHSVYEAAMREYKETVTRSSQYSQDAAFDFQAANAEKSTKHFFRPLDSSLR
ncbi:hypothetical protein PybrP1_004226, partial [[Pythium] brassicae (nom. inval.)]